MHKLKLVILLGLISGARVWALDSKGDVELDIDAVLELAAQPPKDYKSFLKQKYGVHLLKMPASAETEVEFSPQAWIYFHLPGLDVQGAFLHAFAPTLVSDGDEEEVLDFGNRPFGE